MRRNSRTTLGIALAALLQAPAITGSFAAKNWYKGNTHAHTVLCGHADSSPDAVAKWYHDHGYHFLILSEHNIFIDPATVNLPADMRDDFLLIAGEEITGKRNVHSTAMNIDSLIDWEFEGDSVAAVIQNHLDTTKAIGGEHILNHPTCKFAVTAADMTQVEGLHLFELHNAHPNTIQHTHEVPAGKETTESMWDDMLTSGMVVYGVSSDDTHILKEFGATFSNPGRGWIMVRSDALAADDIAAAISQGSFYSTSGVILSLVERSSSAYEVEIDLSATIEAISSPYVIGYSRSEAASGILIEFIGPEGRAVAHFHGPKARMEVPPDLAYVRCNASYTRRTDSGFETFYAWGQPIFTDGRIERLRNPR